MKNPTKEESEEVQQMIDQGKYKEYLKLMGEYPCPIFSDPSLMEVVIDWLAENNFPHLTEQWKRTFQEYFPFGKVIKPRILSRRKIKEIFSDENPGRFIIAGKIEGNKLILIFGNFSKMVLSLGEFQPCADGNTPDFTKFRIIDWGQAIQFGPDYEASADYILKND